ncbi:MAG: HAD family phosphatase [Lachnospiraceae bacterium]|nr:HAD family phosphatase [Lachnospiraceae bacterium]
MKLPKLFIFDMDGLIFDTERIFFELLQKRMAERGYTLTRVQYCRTLGIAGNRLIHTMQEMFGEDYPFHEISNLTSQDMHALCHAGALPVKSGIRELLAFLASHDIPCCVASSTRTATVKKYLESAGLLSYFSYVIGGDMVSESKPNPEIFLSCCVHFDFAPADCLVLEDSENGILAAANGKIPVIGIPDMKYPEDQYRNLTLFLAKDAKEVLRYFSQD